MRTRSAAKRRSESDSSSSSPPTSTPTPTSDPTSESEIESEMTSGERKPLQPNGKATNGHAGASGPQAITARWFGYHAKPRLLSFEESRRLVPWQTDNEWVTKGYRPQLFSIRSCLYSAIGYVHNETVNIHTHSLGAAFFAALIPLHVFPSHFPTFGVFPHPSVLPPPTGADKLCMAWYCACAVTCLGLSSWFHTVQCCNREVCDLAHCGDYIGIVVLIVGSILPGMYYNFHGQRHLQMLYMAGITLAGLTSGYIVLSPHHRGHRWHRTLTFIALGLSAVIPVSHVVIANGLSHAREAMGFDSVVLGGAAYIFGALLYAARFPEKFFPGKVNIVGSSHQIFHCFVLVGAWLQFAALRWMQVGRSLAGW